MARTKIVPGYSVGSQRGVLTDRAATAGIMHGETARVRIRNVEARPSLGMDNRLTVFFCGSSVEVLEKITEGDGQDMPATEMVVHGLKRAPEGFFDLEGIIVSNGRNLLKVTRRLPQFADAI